MAATRTTQDVRRDIQQEREQLAKAVEALRDDLGDATDVAGKLRAKLPAVAAGALGLGFVASGGIGATMRLLMRRGREGHEKARVGRFSLINRD
jgi:hypothetical protein